MINSLSANHAYWVLFVSYVTFSHVYFQCQECYFRCIMERKMAPEIDEVSGVDLFTMMVAQFLSGCQIHTDSCWTGCQWWWFSSNSAHSINLLTYLLTMFMCVSRVMETHPVAADVVSEVNFVIRTVETVTDAFHRISANWLHTSAISEYLRHRLNFFLIMWKSSTKLSLPLSCIHSHYVLSRIVISQGSHFLENQGIVREFCSLSRNYAFADKILMVCILKLTIKCNNWMRKSVTHLNTAVVSTGYV